MKKKKISLIIFVIGVIVLIGGATFLIIKANEGPAIQDGEYLVTAGEWVLDNDTDCVPDSEIDTNDVDAIDGEVDDLVDNSNCEPSVVWDFTEIGKGTLTTNGHVNDYDFIWSLEGGKLLVETDWLYTLENTYDYSLDKAAGVLTLTSEDEKFVFHAVPSESAE